MKKIKKIAAYVAMVAVVMMALAFGFLSACTQDYPWSYSEAVFGPEDYVLIQEYSEDAEGFAVFGRECLYNIYTRKISDIGEGEIDEDQYFGYDVSTEDYERIHSGNVSEEEHEAMVHWLTVSLDPHPEVCEVFYNNDGKVIGHHHTVDGKIVEPSVKCQVKVEVEGQSLEGAYHVIAYVKKNQSE